MLEDDKEDPLCNLCGLTCQLDCKENNMRGPHGLIAATVCGGYESTPGNGHGTLDDLNGYRFNLCEFCLDWLFQRFNVPVSTFDYMNQFLRKENETIEEGLKSRGLVQIMERPEPPPWRPAERRVTEDNWRPEKEAFFTEKEKRDKARGSR